jgi:2-amino-4-hydroxy-6-hydroxymethyldihydropteridine diphosphokinase
MAQVIVALGSNLGDRERQLRDAAAYLESLADGPVVVSDLYETAPVGASTGLYLNAVARFSTAWRPEALFHRMKDWEMRQGRDPDAPRWTDRLIDLDIIDYDGRLWETADLAIPHPECLNRRFVLEPLRDVAPDWTHPTECVGIADALARLPETGIRRLGAFW